MLEPYARKLRIGSNVELADVIDSTTEDSRVFSVDRIDDYFVTWCLGISVFAGIALVAIDQLPVRVAINASTTE